MTNSFNEKDVLVKSVNFIVVKEFSKRNELMKDKNIIKSDLLPAPQEVVDFYTKHGLPEERAKQISQMYSDKLDMFLEFQHGFTISVAGELEMMDGITPYIEQKPNPEYFKNHPEDNYKLVHTDS